MIPESIQSIIDDQKGPLKREDLVMGESINALELAIFIELKQCLLEYENKENIDDPELARIADELKCALDIVQSARTNAERKRVYAILQCLGKHPD